MSRRTAKIGTVQATGAPAMLPLLDRPATAMIGWRGGRTVTVAEFLADVSTVAAALPEHRHALNACRDRYAFLVAFTAALVRRQVTLITSDRAPERHGELIAAYSGYVITDRPADETTVPTVVIPDLGTSAAPSGAGVPVPRRISCGQIAAIAFTSGSTGRPMPHAKTWGMLWKATRTAAIRFGFDAEAVQTVIATVPPQHMYGFETTVLLPMLANVCAHGDRGFYPDDVRRALAAAPSPRIVVTTPFQLRALLRAELELPPIDRIISATAPLSEATARSAEAKFGAPVFEIFGSTETGSIASRRTLDGPAWRLYDDVLLSADGECANVTIPGSPSPILLPDIIEPRGDREFCLIGRRADVVKMAGKRVSLAALAHALREIDGVEDGVFVQPDQPDSERASRLVAFAVAPNGDGDAILRALRGKIDTAFLPRRLILVDVLPRNELGKIQHEKLLGLLRQTAAAAAK